MPNQTAIRRICRIYLFAIPFIVFIIGFALGHSSWKIYLPIWILHSCLMLAAAWLLGLSRAPFPLLMILPWIFITIFAGMGPPPTTVAGWMASALEQQIRYIILIAAGVSFTAGLALLWQQLRTAGETFYSLLGLIAILIKAPLYLLDMLYLGVYRTSLSGIYIRSQSSARPDWATPLRDFFYALDMVEVALTYLATAAFAISLKRAGMLSSAGCRTYLLFSLLGFILSCLPASVPDALAVPSYLVCIPAVTFMMPYFMGISFLWKMQQD